MFADDIAFYTRLTASQQNLDLLENAVATMSSNLDRISLALAPEKIDLLRFSSKGSNPDDTRITAGEHEISFVPTAKFVGINFDQVKLSFKYHINKVQERS